jgi:hypothetical protein
LSAAKPTPDLPIRDEPGTETGAPAFPPDLDSTGRTKAMSTESESARVARTILAMLIAGVAISFAVVGYLVIAGEGPAASTSVEMTVPLVRADRAPVRLPPG